MAINVQKLLPAAKTSAIAKIDASKISSSLVINKKNIDTKKLTALSIRRSEDNVSIVKKSLIDIDGLLKSVLTEDQKTERTKRIRKEQEENEQRETKLETPKESKKFNLPKVSLPGMSFLDRIKRFLFFTALGWLFTKFQDQLPKLTGIIKIITPIAGVVENVFKFILESVVNFIDRGYQTYDKIRGLVKTVGGEKAQGEFDKISGKLNEYINYVLIGGMALTGAINTFANNARKYKPPKPTPQGTPRGPVPQRGPVQRVVRPVQAASIKASRAVIGKQATRQLLRLAKGPLSRLPIVGALVEFGLSWALGDNPGKAAFRGVGTLLLGAVGSLIMPGFGTFIGGYAGAELAGKLYDVLFANKAPGTPVQTQRRGGKVIRRYAKGGQVLGASGRTLTTKKSKKPYIPPKVTQPGKDVGGKKNIRKLFPDPSYKMSVAEWNLAGGAGTYADYEEQWKKQKDKPNPYKALTNIAAILKDIPYGIGTLMGSAVDVALGQKTDENTFKSISFGLENLFDTFRSISNKTSQGVFAIQNQVPTMATGGQVSRTFTPSSRADGDPIKIIGTSIKQRVNESIREVQKQISVRGGKNIPSSLFSYEPPPPKTNYSGSWKPASPGYFNAIEYITGDKNYPSNYDYDGHGTPFNYHDHIAFATPKDKDNAKKALLAAGIQTGSEYLDRIGDPGYHGSNQAIDVPGGQWGGAPGSPITQAQYNGSAKVRSVLGIDKVQPIKTKPGQLPSLFDRPGTDKPVRQTGKASWYGPGFYGNRTANGEKFREGDTEYTAAHPTLPFGTMVTVTNKSNGKSIQVRINDRGPYAVDRNGKAIYPLRPHPTRVIDLNKASRDALGGQDITDVELRYQGGGYIPKQNPKNKAVSLTSYPSYADGSTKVMIQPIIIKETVPIPVSKTSSSTTTFMVAGSVNSSNMQSLVRG